MISYRIDKQSHAKASAEIKDMSAVLSEISPTLQTLLEVLREHETGISSPSINNYRAELQRLISEAAIMTRTIAINSQKLITVSEQAGKHLASIEEHFGAALRNPATNDTPAAISSVQ